MAATRPPPSDVKARMQDSRRGRRSESPVSMSPMLLRRSADGPFAARARSVDGEATTAAAYGQSETSTFTPLFPPNDRHPALLPDVP
ncbi:hypothetical protein LMG27177_02817 [Paraburkholderia fynbosensis]|uniref:Uncharacterized protein n=1 Tax=Paraburkholderia fynbosensis TaxID=1200993 RepID=A0A6J5FZH2_9BURK|nr:hypothetical protein LMG27177_02817 [Paraburkholderia fynbosensis]